MASRVVVDESDPAFILVGFADEQGGECRESLHFQRSHKFDAQDAASGMDTVYAERTGWGGYSGVERVELHPDRVRVVIGRELAVYMAASEFDIGLSLPPDEWRRLRNGLRVVFAGFGSLVEAADAQPDAAYGRWGATGFSDASLADVPPAGVPSRSAAEVTDSSGFVDPPPPVG